ncbi:cytochrome b [Nostoc sp. LEGE 06077]|uniref:cytochrome b n=1 Tax=Nostoc sp. LEGE 06077 TaxID=915325 RepID=UPI001880DEF5|nr:cytochrome b [Nostoc sp. LEGE 06077]MBE9209733.1 cytochrome b [Nostoc sp. LEGE 06077]
MNLTSAVKKARVNSAFKQLMSVHWIMFACYLVLFTTGSGMARLSRGTFFRSELYDFHKSIGALVVALLTWRILVLLRVWWRKYTKNLPRVTSEWTRKFILHTFLYFLMFAVPVSGFFFSNSYQSNNVRFFGLTLPDFFPQNSLLVDLGRSIHFWIAYTFLALILLHTLQQWKVIRANWRRFKAFFITKRLKNSA